MYTSLFFFGTHPKLSYAELRAVCETWMQPTQYTLASCGSYATVTSETVLPYAQYMERLGGTVKIAELIDVNEDTLISWVTAHLPTDSKNRFGVSVYGTHSPSDRLHSARGIGMSLKRALQEEDRSVRFVQSQDPTLSAVIVTKEHLIEKGLDLCIVVEGSKKTFARTVAVQPFEEFSHRDYGRPGRDSRSGMLPPKLARMMVNLARPKPESSLLDPFCGSGTILQEALLMGVQKVVGSDISEKAVRDTDTNLQWLELPEIPLFISSAKELVKDPDFRRLAPFDAIVFEGFLGQPSPKPHEVERIVNLLEELYLENIPRIATSLAPQGTLVGAFPFWRVGGKEAHLPIARILEKSGLAPIQEPLYYFRPSAVVGREIIIAQRAAE